MEKNRERLIISPIEILTKEYAEIIKCDREDAEKIFKPLKDDLKDPSKRHEAARKLYLLQETLNEVKERLNIREKEPVIQPEIITTEVIVKHHPILPTYIIIPEDANFSLFNETQNPINITMVPNEEYPLFCPLPREEIVEMSF
jgi:hypothetical protein